MDRIKNSVIYIEDIESILLQNNCDWNRFKNKTFLISGATGLIGTVLVDMLVLLNKKYDLRMKLILISRHEVNSNYDFIQYIKHDITYPFEFNSRIDFIVHAASNTHPLQYSQFPIETIKTNVFGTYNLLNLAEKNDGCRFLFVSSVERYGDDIQGHELGFREDDFGYLNCNNPRSCYSEGKRLCESLCASYKEEKSVDYITACICRSYGPTLKIDDSKAQSQFLRNALLGKNIVLKSDGTQFYSYIYSADAASAIIYLLINGKCGNVYNIADEKSKITLKDLASLIAENAGVKVIYEIPNEIESKGYSKAVRSIMNTEKILKLGWNPYFDISNGVKRTFECLKSRIEELKTFQ